MIRTTILTVALVSSSMVTGPAAATSIDVVCVASGDLQTAIDNASPGDTLNVSGTCLGPIDIAKDLTIVGEGPTTTTIDATGTASPAVTVEEGVEVVAQSLTITGGQAFAGGGIDLYGALTIEDVTVDANTADFGGGIMIEGTGSLTAVASAITHNVAHNSGGGIYSDFGGTATLTDTSVSDNLAEKFQGGGIYQSGETFTISGGVVDRNEAFEDGGGIFVDADGVLSLRGTSVSGNVTDDQGSLLGGGGGIHAQNAAVSLTDAVLADNSTYGWGGGLYAAGGSVTLTRTAVTGNRTRYSVSYGGGLYVEAASLSVTASKIEDNATRRYGGGIALFGPGTPPTPAVATIADSVISGNTATDTYGSGGGIWSRSSILTVTDTTISVNASVRSGGGIDATYGSADLARVVVSGNTSGGGDGAGLSADGTQLTVIDSTIDNNDAVGGSGGGGSFSGDAEVRIERSAITNNSAGNGGGFDTTSSVAVTLVNSTVSGNVAGQGGGIQTERTGPSILGSTITNNIAVREGGGIWQLGGTTTSIRESILAGNQAGTGPDCYSAAADDVLSSHGYTLIGSTDGCNYDDDTSDLIGADPMLEPLADNGGYTMSHDLAAGSVAVDHVPTAACSESTDQRLVDRPQGNGCDIGAVEYTSSPVSQCGLVDIAGSTFESDICWLAGHGITKGCNPPDNTKYCPNDSVTRGQMAAFLVRALGLTDDGGKDWFGDDDGTTFEADINRLAQAGVTKGCNPPDNTKYCPNGSVTRGQMAAFLHRALTGGI